MRNLSLALLLTGCAHRGGMALPGPLRGMGTDPVPYADSGEEHTAETHVGDASDARADTPPSRRRTRRGDARGEQVARTAASLIEHRKLVVRGETYRYDCSGLVEAAHAGARIDLRGSSRSLYEKARSEGLLHRRKVPVPGDVAFFDDTYDRNHNRRRDDDLTHVAIVESVAADGTITLVHKGGRGVVRMEMNLRRPAERRDEHGRELNDYLRSSRDKDGGPVLSGQLWRAFASLWAVDVDGVSLEDAHAVAAPAG
ncbi:MAG: CHAP domain-containing protein [Myxococcota bacterium]|nr:CHAP domain-containing protein [Myxococcota bacterium]